MSADEFPVSEVTPGCRMLRNVGVYMRDGVRLATTVILPEAEGSYPVILVRSAYGRVGGWAEGRLWASRGYAYVTQDCRGRFDSEGEWYPFTVIGNTHPRLIVDLIQRYSNRIILRTVLSRIG